MPSPAARATLWGAGHRLWSLKGRLEIPLTHVTGAEADPEAVFDGEIESDAVDG